MILKGKAKTDFLNEYGHLEWEVDERYLLALITDFFDKYRISIQNWGYQEVEKEFGFDGSVVYMQTLKNNEDFKDNRIDALKESILNANEIYNRVFA